MEELLSRSLSLSLPDKVWIGAEGGPIPRRCTVQFWAEALFLAQPSPELIWHPCKRIMDEEEKGASQCMHGTGSESRRGF